MAAAQNLTGPIVKTGHNLLFISSFIYILFLVSISITDVAGCLVFGAYPLFLSLLWKVPFKVFRRGIPGFIVIFIFALGNIFFDKTFVGKIGALTVTNGMLSSAVLVMKGTFSIWILFILIEVLTFTTMCRLLTVYGVPSVFVVQLMLLERYLVVLKEEALSIRKARDCRAFGNRGKQIRIAAVMIGSFFLRTVERAERIYRAMVSRGFNSCIKAEKTAPLRLMDYLSLVGIVMIFIMLRVFF